MATAWMAINSNKRNLALDLTKPKSIEIVHRLAAKADVVMENFRPGIMDRMGIGYEALSGINPRLIYCAVSGFGQNGPERTTAAYDGKIQAMSGIMSVTGHPGEGPMRAGFAVCDAIGGMTAAFAVSSALFQRTHTGRGQLVDVAMLDARSRSCPRSSPTTRWAATCRASPATARRAGCRRPTCSRSRAATSCSRSTTRSSSARCRARSASRTSPRTRASATGRRRVANDAALRAIIEEVFASDDDKTWEARLTKADVPCSRVWTHRRDRRPSRSSTHRDVLQRVETRYGPMTVVGSGFRLAHGGGSVEREPALPGEHAEEVLAEAGYGASEIAALRRDGYCDSVIAGIRSEWPEPSAPPERHGVTPGSSLARARSGRDDR